MWNVHKRFLLLGKQMWIVLHDYSECIHFKPDWDRKPAKYQRRCSAACISNICKTSGLIFNTFRRSKRLSDDLSFSHQKLAVTETRIFFILFTSSYPGYVVNGCILQDLQHKNLPFKKQPSLLHLICVLFRVNRCCRLQRIMKVISTLQTTFI